MLRMFRLTACLLAGFALPAFAQTPATRPAAPTMSPAARPAAPATSAAKRIDVNGASEADLASLPGIGPVTAKAIVAGRPWDDLGDLVKKKAVNQPTYERNKDRFALADINSSPVDVMAKVLPGIGDVRARKIAEGRPYGAPGELVSKNVLTAAQYGKIKDLVTY